MKALLLTLLAAVPVVATAEEAAPRKELAILPRQIAVPEVANSMQLLSLTLDGVAWLAKMAMVWWRLLRRQSMRQVFKHKIAWFG